MTVEPASVRIRVPATSANLGPGFDAVGLALGLYDEVTVTVTDVGLAVHVTGEGAGELPTGEDHLVVRALRAGFAVFGRQPAGLRLSCVNRIPQARGLGSSAAAVVAGVLASRALTGAASEPLATDRLADTSGPVESALALATELEGHPDNVAACLLGGATVAWSGPDGPRAVRVEPAGSLRTLLFVPTERASTAQARGLLPASVPHADAAANAARAALLSLALTGHPDLLFAATEDRLHQQYRAVAMPVTAALMARLRAGGVPAVVSGAGPAVLALVPGPGAAALIDQITATGPLPTGWRAVEVRVDRGGAQVHRD